MYDIHVGVKIVWGHIARWAQFRSKTQNQRHIQSNELDDTVYLKTLRCQSIRDIKGKFLKKISGLDLQIA